jgi:hypothetical protein
MRPEPLKDRPFFRPEAESHRRLRHLGDVILFRPLPLKLVTLYPVLVVAVLVFALSQVALRLRFVGVMEETPGPGETLRLALDQSAAASLRRGDRIELRLAGSAARRPGTIAELAPIPCSRLARALLPTHAQAAPPDCLQVTVATDSSGAMEAATPPITVELWSPPQTYLTHLFRR